MFHVFLLNPVPFGRAAYGCNRALRALSGALRIFLRKMLIGKRILCCIPGRCPGPTRAVTALDPQSLKCVRISRLPMRYAIKDLVGKIPPGKHVRIRTVAQKNQSQTLGHLPQRLF